MSELRSKHEEYRRSRAALGYVYGEVIDDVAMTDPFLTDFDQLSEEAKQAFDVYVCGANFDQLSEEAKQALEKMTGAPKPAKPKKSAPRAKKAAKTAEKDTGKA